MPQQNEWTDTLYNGLVTTNGAPPKVASGMITKPNREKQLAEPMPHGPEVITDNYRNRSLGKKSKQRFSIHRAVSFLPQE